MNSGWLCKPMRLIEEIDELGLTYDVADLGLGLIRGKDMTILQRHQSLF